MILDYQNVYARGLLLTARGHTVDAARRLQSVHVFRGEPSSRRNPRRHAAARRQVAMVLGAERDQFDVAILFSSDTDLIPAVEAVRQIGKRCEVAAWRPLSGYGNGLRMRGVWCHWLDMADYDRLHDPVNYTVGGGR